MDLKSHWERIYRDKLPTQVSWYQPHALRSLDLIRRVNPPPTSMITPSGDRARYVAQVRQAVRPGGFVLVATFADDGPTRCSGLEVARYSPEALHAEFGAPLQLMTSEREEHVTPAGVRQAFIYCLCRVD